MRETTKTVTYYPELVGSIIASGAKMILDVGCGDDKLDIPGLTVIGWDTGDGDAQYLKGIDDGAYDGLWSSHCLEHMVDVSTALANWIRVVKPGGWLIILVPHFVFYEKMMWPSRFNGDHKASFALEPLTSERVGRKNHYTVDDIASLCVANGSRLVRYDEMLDGMNFEGHEALADQTQGSALSQIAFIIKKGIGNVATTAYTHAASADDGTVDSGLALAGAGIGLSSGESAA